jgi:hypothetical protein
MKTEERHIDGDIACCAVPPRTCPRRYCSIAMRELEKDMGLPEPVKKKKKKPTGANQ